MAAGAAVSVASVAAGVCVGLAGGQDAGRPLGAAPARAQRVDLNSPSADPSTNAAPPADLSSNSAPPADPNANSQETTHDVTVEVKNFGLYIAGICLLDDETKSCNNDVPNNLTDNPSATLTAKVPAGQRTVQVQGLAFNGQIHSNVSDFPNATLTLDASAQTQCVLFNGTIFSFTFNRIDC